MRIRFFSDLHLETRSFEPSHADADLVIGAVLVAGGRAPVVVTEDMVRTMKKGAVIVDVAVDQGGCIETSRPTSHSHPVFVQDGVTHYCVTNMPGASPRTSTFALTEAVLPYALRWADKELEALREDPGFARAFTYEDALVIQTVANALHLRDLYRAGPFI